MTATVHAWLDRDTLRLSGRIDRQVAPALWPDLPTTTWRVLDLSDVDGVDTAGLALLIELLARRCRSSAERPVLVGVPDSVQALCLAYRWPLSREDDPHDQNPQ